MNESKNAVIDQRVKEDYKYGFITDIESDTLAPGISEKNDSLYIWKKERALLVIGLAIKSL